MSYPANAYSPSARGSFDALWRSPSRWWRALTRPATTPETATLDPKLDPALIVTRARTAILQALAERCPSGWRALLLSPPPHPRSMTWHVHLVAEVALDLVDGRTVPTTPPTASHEWTLPSGRRVTVAVGDPSPAPSAETRALRVSGPYFSVTYASGLRPRWRLGLGFGATRHGDLNAAVRDQEALDALLREALAQCIGQRAMSDGSAMGYSPTSWVSHKATWLEIRVRG